MSARGPRVGRWRRALGLGLAAPLAALVAALASCGGGGNAPVATLALIGGDGQAYLLRDGGEPEPVLPAGDAVVAYRWPVWAPGGDRLLLLGTRLTGEGRTEGVATFVDVGAASAGSDGETIALADAPIYAAWSTDGERVAVVAPLADAFGVELLLGEEAEGAWGLHTLGLSGRSIYLAWEPGGSRLALRRESEGVARVELWAGEAGGVLALGTETAARFHAPGWTGTGGEVVAGWEGRDGPGLRVVAAGGDLSGVIATLEGRSAFVPANRGDAVAYAVTAHPSGILYRDLAVTDPASGRTRVLAPGKLLAFFWSPDDARIAYLTTSPEDTLLHWHVVEVASGRTREVAAFRPSPDQFTYYQYFDQYASSSDVWSPDGSALTMAGDVPGLGEGVFVVDAASGAARRVGSGRIAVWPRAVS